jgi:hypothetical protein
VTDKKPVDDNSTPRVKHDVSIGYAVGKDKENINSMKSSKMKKRGKGKKSKKNKINNYKEEIDSDS